MLRHKMGPLYLGLKPLPCTNPPYWKIINYRMYLLRVRERNRSGCETRKVRYHIRRMKIGSQDHSFNRKDPILVSDCLSRLVAEANKLDMTEAQALVALPHFLKDCAL